MYSRPEKNKQKMMALREKTQTENLYKDSLKLINLSKDQLAVRTNSKDNRLNSGLIGKL